MAEPRVIRTIVPEAPQPTRDPQHGPGVKMRARDVHVYYGDNHALQGVDLDITRDDVTALIGPSGCGKSTFLRCFNRMNDLIPETRVAGNVLLDGEDLYTSGMDVVALRRRVGMVFQKSNPFPKSIFDNVAYGLRINGIGTRSEMSDRVEMALQRAALWDEVKDRLRT